MTTAEKLHGPKVPRGIRNNNPGDIEADGDPWQGLAKPHEMTPEQQAETRFCVFTTPIYGIRAMARTLITYQDKYGIRSVEAVVARWAPAEDRNDVDAYIRSLVSKTGFKRGEVLDMHKFEHLAPMVEGIIWHENGVQPYSRAQITKALVLAGSEPSAPINPMKGRTGRGAALASTTGGASALLDTFQEIAPEAQSALGAMMPYLDMAKYGLAALAVAGFGLMVWARYDDGRKGLR